MGLFKEILCAECGEKTKILKRMKLGDGNFLCHKHAAIIPSYMYSSVTEKYTLEDYHSLQAYITYSNEYLRPKFHETHSFHTLHLDTENLLLYIGYGIDNDTIFFNLHNISRFDMVFKAENYKDGVLGTKVNGKIMYEIGMSVPYFYYEDVLSNNAKAKAKKSFFGNKIEYENPEGMDDFLFYFERAWNADQEASEDYVEYESYSEPQNNNLSELQQAMALFMIDTIEEITLDELKILRNRLVKTFHPDVSSADDTKHAQKINAAYEVIKKALQ